MNEFISVVSLKTGKTFKITAFKSYNVEQTIDIPADAFNFSLGNYNSEISDNISAGDKLFYVVNNTIALEGYIDDITPEYSKDSNDIKIIGRDKMSVILDNDATPKTYYNIGLNDYLAKVLPQYGITNYIVENNAKFKKIVVSPGENEYSIIERLAKERNLTVFYDSKGVLQCTKLNSSTSQIYTFSNDLPDALRIKKADINISADVRNEVIVYGENKKGKSHIIGSYKDTNLKVKKRKILNESDIDTKSDAENRAKIEFYNINKSAFSITITTRTKVPIFLNSIARVYIKRLGLDCKMLVDAVIYSKDAQRGSETTIVLKLIQGVKVSFKNNNIPILPKL